MYRLVEVGGTNTSCDEEHRNVDPALPSQLSMTKDSGVSSGSDTDMYNILDAAEHGTHYW